MTEKVHPVGTVLVRRGGHAHFPAKTGPKNQYQKVSVISMISHDQSID